MTMLDPTLAPEGEHLFIVTAVAPYDAGTPWNEMKERYMDELLASFESNFPDLRDNVTFMETGTPVTIERYTRSWRGATYGWELIPSQIGSKRLGHDTPIEGLYLSGHWTEEGPASFRVILSGINTATRVLSDAGKDNVIPSFKPEDIPGMAM
jgi:prolycopene isomerase